MPSRLFEKPHSTFRDDALKLAAMSLLALYARVLAELGPEKRLGLVLALANILLAAVASLVVVVEWALGVPIAGSLLLFVLGSAIYAFTVAALGILLGTLATTMGQFGLLAIPVFVVTQLLSGATTPMESMPTWLQWTMRTLSPTPHFVTFSQGVLYRGAGLDVVWPEIAKIITIGAAYFGFALARFRKVIFA